MSTLAALKKQIAELQKKAEAIAQAEKRDAAAKARALIADYALTAEDVGLGQPAKAGKARQGAKAGRKAAAKAAGVARYRDPATGKTWTGVGRAPTWIADAKDRSKFLIDGAAAAAAPTEKPAKAAKPGKPARKAQAAKPAAPRKKAAAKAAPAADAAAPAPVAA